MQKRSSELEKEIAKLKRLVSEALAKGMSLSNEEILEQSRKVDQLLNELQAGGSTISSLCSYHRLQKESKEQIRCALLSKEIK